MKKKNLNFLLALLAALALVFAGACSDGSDDDGGSTETPSDDSSSGNNENNESGGGNNESNESGGGNNDGNSSVTDSSDEEKSEEEEAKATEVTKLQVEELLQAIGDITANDDSESWPFASGSFGDNDMIFTVTGTFTSGTPSAKTTQDNLRGAGSNGAITKNDNPCTVDLSDVTVTKPNEGYTASISVTVSLAEGYADSYTLSGDLASVTIVLDSGSTEWAE